MPPHDGTEGGGGYLRFEYRLELRDGERDEGKQGRSCEYEEEDERGSGGVGEQPVSGVEDFAPVRAVGNGDMGTVFLVSHRRTGAAYAMKVMKKEVLKRRDTFFRADLERDILASLDHPFLPKLYTHFETLTHRFLVMNYCAGGDLNVLRQMQAEKSFSEAAARFYASEVVLALEHLHERGIIYRDLKPENILVNEEGHIMLADFDLSARMAGDKYVNRPAVLDNRRNKRPEPRKRGEKRPGGGGALSRMLSCAVPPERPKANGIARVTPLEVLSDRESAKGRSHSFVGTEEYVAPEMVWGTGHGKAVDWWALGILLYEMVFGKTPFKGDNRKSTFVNIICRDVVVPGHGSPLKDLIEKLLAKDPTKRLGSTSGAAEVKSHPFFAGVQWDAVQFVSRPPHVPAPFSLEDEAAAREKRLAAARAERDDLAALSSGGGVEGPQHVEQDMRLTMRDVGRDAVDEQLAEEGESWAASPRSVSEEHQLFDLPGSTLRHSRSNFFDDMF